MSRRSRIDLAAWMATGAAIGYFLAHIVIYALKEAT